MEDKETPMEPDLWFRKIPKCGRCMKCLDIIEHTYCPQCGQKIDWTKLPDNFDALFVFDCTHGIR